MIISLIIAVAVTILAVFFASYNQTVVAVNFFGYPVQGTVGLLMVVALGTGCPVGRPFDAALGHQPQLGIDAAQAQIAGTPKCFRGGNHG